MGELDGIFWRDGAAFVRLKDVGAPMLITQGGDRIADLTAPAESLLAKFELPCEPGLLLPGALKAELDGALLGEAIQWRPRGDSATILGCTRYRLGDRHHLVLMREITAQQRAMSARLHQQRLQETGKLVAHIAHELRTPLSSIVYNADVLGHRDLGENADLVTDIQLAAESLRRTIAGLLDFVRLGPPVGTSLTLRELCSRVSSLLRPMLRAGQHELTMHLHDGDLPIPANPLTLEQVFVNLVVNAMEASDKPRRIEIRSEPIPAGLTRSWRARAGVLVRVSDDGPGVAAERRDSVFDAFVTTKPQGTGLGLTLAREALTSLGGQIWLEDRTPGASFALVLPVARTPEAAP